MEISEELLWRYIDGDCSDDEREFVRQNLCEDPELRAEYADLMTFHMRFADLLKSKRLRQGASEAGRIDTAKMLAQDYDVFGSARNN